MALKVASNKAKGNSSGKKFPITPVGTYPARVVQIIDMGLHPKINYTTKAVEGQQYKVRITYELLNLFMTDEEGNELPDKPRWISETKSIPVALGQADAPAQSWYGNCGIIKRYRAIMGDSRAIMEDLSLMLTKACAVVVVHEPRKDGTGDFAKVGDVIQDPYKTMGMEAPALKNPPKFFDLEDPDFEMFEDMASFVKEDILKNLEFTGSKLEEYLAGGSAKTEQKTEEPASTFTEESPW